jgi:hypothetical protein
MITLHPMVLLFNHSPRFGLDDILVPPSSPVEPTLNTVGAGSMYVLLLVIFTSLLRRHMRRPLWRKLHDLVFPVEANSSCRPALPFPWRRGYCAFACAAKG